MPSGEKSDDLRHTLAMLEQRLTAVERKLGLIHPPPLKAQPLMPHPVERKHSNVPANIRISSDVVLEPEPESVSEAIVIETAPPPLRGKIFPDNEIEQVAGGKTQSWESMIGLNWAGWVGAIVFVLGMLFFLKYAWDQGWIHPTPTMRVIAAIMTGVIVSGLGEWMHHRRVKVLAATLHGAGLAIVIASFFAAYAGFEPDQRVLGATGAFVGVCIAAAIGVMLSLHVRSMVLAIIALLGAYLAPFVLNTGEDKSAQLLAYLGVLSAVGWTLSYLRPRWVPIRAIVWVGTFLSFTAWWFDMGEEHGHIMLAAIGLTIYYFGFVGEMILTLRKDADQGLSLRTSTAIISLLNTAAAFGLLRAIFDQPAYNTTLGLAAILLAGVQGAAAFATRSRGFSVSSLLQSAPLLTLAVPLLFDQFFITLAWMILAAVLGVLAWDLNIPSARKWAIVLLGLSIFRLVAFDSFGPILLSFGTFTLSQWMLTAWSIAVIAHVIGWLRPGKASRWPALEQRFAEVVPHLPPLRVAREGKVLEYATPAAAVEKHGPDITGIIATQLGTIVFIVSSASHYEAATLTLLALLWTIPIAALATKGRALGYLPHATLLAALITVKWFVTDGIDPLFAHWNNPIATDVLPPFFNLVTLSTVLLCGVIGGLIVQSVRLQRPRAESFAYAVWLALIVLIGLTFDACRTVDWLATHGQSIPQPDIVKQVVMSVLWASVGFATIVIGFRRNIAPLRYAALGLLGVTLVKILILDMAEVKAVWRILSFIAVGGLLLAVSYIYHKHLESHKLAS